MNNHLPFTNFESFVQCLDDRRCRFITPDPTGSSFQDVIAAGTQWSNRISKALAANPAIVAPLDEIPGKIQKEKSYYLVFPWTKFGFLYNIHSDICSFYIVDTQFKLDIKTFPLQKNSSHSRSFNRLASIFREHGVAEALIRRYNKFGTCGDGVPRRAPTDKERLKDLITYFIFYGCGIVIAGAAFVIEIIYAIV